MFLSKDIGPSEAVNKFTIKKQIMQIFYTVFKFLFFTNLALFLYENITAKAFLALAVCYISLP